MREKIFLILLFTIIIGIQPVLAQSGSEGSVKPTAPEKTVKEGEVVINITLASDSEFTQALQTAGDIELVNDSSDSSAKTEKSNENPNQGKAK